MSTLPLDLVLHIVDVGDLSIKDVFSLYNANRLLKQKLSHPYFWNVLYKRSFGRIYSQLEIETDPESYYTASCAIYKCSLELESSLKLLDEQCISTHPKHITRDAIANLPWTNEQYQRYSLDVNYLPILLKMFELEDAVLRKKLKAEEKGFDFFKASVIEHLLSNQLYNIGLKNARRINSQEQSPSSYESMLFNLSLLESKSYCHFHYRRRFLKQKIKLLEKFLKPSIVQTYSTLNNDAAKRRLYSHYTRQGLQLLLASMESRVCREHSGIIENFDILKLYSGKCKAHPYLLFAIATKILYEGWKHFGLEVPDPVEPPICTPWCVIYQDIYFDYVNSKLSFHKHEFDSHGVYNIRQSMSYLFQLFDLSRGLKSLRRTADSTKILSIVGVEDTCTDSNFITKMKFSRQSFSSTFKFSQFMEHLGEEDAPLHQVVFEHKSEVSKAKDHVNTQQLHLRGLVIRTRHNQAAVILGTNESFCKILTIGGTVETVKSGFVTSWVFNNVLEINTFVRLIGFNLLFSAGFRSLEIDLETGSITFVSCQNIPDTSRM